MYRLVPLAVALTVAATTAPAFASARSLPPAGPWYTPKELKALEIYANASFAEKQRILAGGVAAVSRARSLPPASPWYTPKELKALEIYANASFAEKQRILAGESPKSVSHGFQWRSGVAGGVFVTALVLVGAAVLVRRRTAPAQRPDAKLD